MKRILLLTILTVLFYNCSFAQGNSCAQATPFCEAPGGAGVTFPNSVGTTAPTGPSYGCLCSQPNPAYFFIKTSAAGNMVYNISQVNGSGTGIDVDFVAWGPFSTYSSMCNNLTGACDDGFFTGCGTGLPQYCSGNIEDCSYSTSATEVMTIASPGAGNYYLIMITNYAGVAGNITFTQTSGPASDCSITCPNVLGGDGIVMSGGAQIPSTIPCGSAPFGIYASNNTPFGSPITPAVMVSFLNNTNTSNIVTWYEDGSPLACFGPAASCGTYTLTPSTNTDLQFSTASPSAITTFTLCETNSAQPDMTYTVTNLATHNVIATGTWLDDGSCQSITLPAGSITGVATFTASCGACVTSTDWGGATFNPSVAGPGTHTITYTFDPGGTCAPYVYTKTVTIAAPTVTASADVTICSGASTTLTASGTPSTPTVTFTNTADVAISSSGTPTVTSPITVSGLSGTVGTSLVSVNLNIAHTYDGDLDISLQCPDGTLIDLSSDNGGASNNYTNTTFITGGTAVTSGSAPFTGNFAPEAPFSNLSGCNINGTWTLIVADDGNGDGGTINDWSITFNNQVSYTWAPSGSLSSSTGSSVTATPTVTTTYTLTGTDASGCNVTDLVTVNVNPTPTVTNSTTASICSGGTLNIPLTSSPAATSYSWAAANNTNVNGETTGAQSTSTIDNTLTLAAGVTTAQVVTYTVTGSNGSCTSSTQTISVTVNPTPVVSTIGNISTACQNTALAVPNFTVTPSGTVSWTNNNTGIGGIGASGTGNIGTITPTTAGSATITATATLGSCSTSSSSTFVITVNSRPTVTATSITVCEGSSATITAGGANTYVWNTGVTTAGLTINPVTATTTYTVTGTSTATTCTNTATGTITMNPRPTVTASSITVCQGSSATITAGGANTYVWNTGVTTAGLTINPVSATTTYTVTGTAANTCTNTATGTITMNTRPIVTASSITVCEGSSATITAGGANTYVWNTGVTTAGLTINPVSATTTYTVTGTAANTCTNTATGTITMNPRPTVTASSITVCEGSSATITAGGANTYVWNTGVTTAGLTINPVSATTTYTVTGTTTATSCTNTATGTITMNPRPTVTASSFTVCQNGSATITAGGANTYLWNTGVTTAGLTINPVTATTTYTVTGTAANTCTNTATGTITMNPRPTVTATSFTVCELGSATITAGGANTYVWNTGVTTAGLTINPVTATTTYTVTGTAANTCTNTATGTITMNPRPTVTVTPVTVCEGSSATLTASGANTYVWNTGVTTAGLTINPVNATTTYTVTGTTTATSCTNTATGTITMNPRPIVTASSFTVCQGASATITAGGANTYLWNTGVTTAGLTINPVNATTTYTVTGTAANTCTNTATGTITMNTLPTISSATANQTVCSGGTVNSISFNTNPAAGVNVNWTNSNAAIGLPVSGTGTTINGYTAPNVISQTQGTISVIVTNSGTGCSSLSTSAGTVTINPNPTITTPSTPTNPLTCGGSNGSLNGLVVSGTPTITYSWNGGAFSGASISGLAAGGYNLTATDGNGCIVNASYTLTDPTTPAAPAYILSSDTICVGGTTTLSVNNPVGGQTYNWFGPSGFIGTNNSITISNATIANGGNYSVSTTAAGCTGAQSPTTTLVVNANPTAVITTSNTSFCVEANTVLSGTTSNPGGTASISGYQWLFNGAPATAPATGSTYTVTQAGNYQLQITNNNGCTNTSANSNITIFAEPAFGTTTPNTVNSSCVAPTGAIGNIIPATVTNGSANYTYTWYGASGVLSTSTIASTSAPSLTGQSAGTYSLVVVDNNGCNDTLTATITNANAPSEPSIVTNVPNCAGSPNNQIEVSQGAGQTITWYTSSGAFLSSGNTYTPSVVATTTLNVTATENGCESNSFQVVVVVNPKPAAPAVANQTICSGATLNDLTATGGTGTINWYSNAGLTTLVGTGSPYASGISNINPSQTFLYAAETDLGCLGDGAPVTITVNSNPLIDASLYSIDSASCGATAIDGGLLGITVTSGNPGYTYNWTDVGGNPVTTSTSTPDLTGVGVGSYNLEVIDINGCTATYGPLHVVSASTPPTPGFDVFANDTTYCAGDAVGVLTATGLNIEWYSNPLLVIGNQIGTGNNFTPTGITTDTVLYVVSNINSCLSLPRPVTIVFNNLPIVGANSPTVCAGQQVTLNGTGANIYSWTNGVINGLAFTPASSGTYDVTGTDVNGCTNTATANVTINNLPIIGATQGLTPAVCSLDTIVLNGTGAATYVWNNGVTDGVGFVPTASGPYQVIGTDANGCVDSVVINVTVNPLPTFSINGGSTSPVCLGGQTTLTASSTNGTVVYVWNNGVVNGTPFTPTAGTYYVVEGTDGNGCSLKDSLQITVNPLPTVAANAPTVCQGQSATLSGTGAIAYTWDNGVVDGVSFVPIATGPYVVTGTDANGCVNTATVTVTVNTIPTVGATQGATDSTCAGSSYVLNGTGATTYTWDNGVVDGVSFVPASSGPYTVTGTDGNGCTNVFTVTVTINAVPTVDITSVNDTIPCGATTAFLTGITTTATNPTYTWTGPSILSGGNTAAPQIGSAGSYSVVVTDASGCSSTNATVNVVSNSVVAAFTPDVTGGFAPLPVNFDNQSTGAISYSWSFGNGVTGPSLGDTTHTYSVNGTYQVILTAYSNGCQDTATATIIVDANSTIIVPNIFSPNGDNVNDVLTILSTGLKELNIDIFNRWGSKVYVIDSPGQNWDGKLTNGEPAAEGTYFYILKAVGFDKKEYEAQGPIMLVK